MEFTAHRKSSKQKRKEMVSDRFLFLIDQPLDQSGFFFRLFLWVLLIAFSFKLLSSSMNYEIVSGFWHNVNLPFHEAGHLIFGFLPPLGVSFMGTGMQLLMPMICGVTLLFKTKDTFGATVPLWWFGENCMDIAPYIADARSGTLPLLGGNTGEDSPYGFHDWEFILGELNLQMHDIAIGEFVWNSGKMIMVLALIWGATILGRSFYQRCWK